MSRDQLLEALRDDLLTVKEYANATRQNEEYVRQRCREGKQRGAVRLDGQWRIKCSEALASVF